MTTDQPPGFEFPCPFQIKAMGLDDGAFHDLVLEIIGRHCETIRHETLSLRASRGGKYVSVTIEIEAQNRAQLDAIYDDLTAHERVLMRL
jgi:putative lipoic acid-binding regulatory protein